jgi:hypothetical protein
VFGVDALGWQATVLQALEAVLLLRRADEHSESDVQAAQESLVKLTRWLDNGCAENDLEVAYVVSSQLAVFSQDREVAAQALCRVHCRVRAAGDIWLERRLLQALERCYLASDGQEKFARASLTIRNKKQDQCNQAIAEVVASAGHSTILSWTPRSAAQAASAAKTSQVLQAPVLTPIIFLIVCFRNPSFAFQERVDSLRAVRTVSPQCNRVTFARHTT